MAQPAPQPVESALEHLISTFNELNSPLIDELDSEPSPLEFMRYVARNAPFVVRGGAASWKATRNGTPPTSSLPSRARRSTWPSRPTETPTRQPGRPSSAQRSSPNLMKSRSPLTSSSHMLSAKKPARASPPTQNDNLRDEYSTLLPDAQKDIPFARIALAKAPDAVNLWIGNSKSVTAAHKDNFENIFVQIRGRKHFVLLPPLCHACMNEKPLPPATYVRAAQGALALRLDAAAEPVPFVTWDPDRPQQHATSLSCLARPLRVTLEPGDMLYLPAMWYHKVKQSCVPDDEGFAVAINYWSTSPVRRANLRHISFG